MIIAAPRRNAKEDVIRLRPLKRDVESETVTIKRQYGRDMIHDKERRNAGDVWLDHVTFESRVRNVVLDTGAADFAERTADLAREVLSQGPVSAVSCVGVGSGSMRWSEEELKRLELGVVGSFARGCHYAGIAQFCLLSAAGSTARSRFR